MEVGIFRTKPVTEMRDIYQGYEVTATAPNSIRYVVEKPAASKSQIALHCSLVSSSICAPLMIRSRPAPLQTTVQLTVPEATVSSGTDGERQWFGGERFRRACSIIQSSSIVFA